MSSIKRYRSLKKVLKKYVDEPTDETYTDACDAIYGYIEEAVGEDGLDPDNDTFEGYKEAVGEGNVGELDEEIFALSDKASNETLSADQIKILFRRIFMFFYPIIYIYMSDNDENLGDKRRPDFMEPDQPQKKQKVVNLQAFVPNNRDLIGELTQLGQNLALVADASRVPETEISDNFVAIQQQLNDALQEAFNQAQLVRRQNEEQRMASEMAQMGEQERDQIQLLRADFLRRLQPLAQRMSEQLTYGEQAQMFNIILNSIDTRLNENDFNNSEPNVAALLLELGTLTINFAIEQLAVTLSNLYQATPDLIRQLTSLIVASGMAFNYLPANLRGGFNGIPYLGPLFALMNRINPQLRNIQNSGAVVTTIYYLLRNAGIDTTESIRLLGASAAQLVSDCSIQAGRLVCQGAGLVSDAATSIIDRIADRLGNVLTSEYQDFSFRVESQESVSSVRSLSSQITVNTLQSQNLTKK